ncbi:hypothetical protein K493DRAFT_94806 [Basidiobolus meristosporus CBS 931.73]|uniref:Uncharacterized protein n=1 Tax=Basidiobolus meristosporus CBS 931.73 TaxID=1314790 RepID=A0A1Y1X6P6_9FUNG|nr:hypothetical protein K493DRAFT_94806 [Basidiobolus meristosporus CBS 931.73]|eukprot:ORX81459.1 hypothetical protein K493DRAFT_94806 [Basidiobolus meristosporus CBS 931.73]
MSSPSCSNSTPSFRKRKFASLETGSPKSDDFWKDVNANIRKMDSLYDASFYTWLKNEENVLVTSVYLHRIANEYTLERIISALKWLITEWRIESVVLLVRHITLDWAVPMPDMTEQAVQTVLDLAERRRAHLVKDLTKNWSCNALAQLTGGLMNGWVCMKQKERFLAALTSDWDFRRLSEFFSYLQTSANLDYRIKVTLLQEAVRRDKQRHAKYSTSAKSPTVLSPPRRRRSRQGSNLASKKIKSSTDDLEMLAQVSEDVHANNGSSGPLSASLTTDSIGSLRSADMAEIDCCCPSNSSCSHQTRHTSGAPSSSTDAHPPSEIVDSIGMAPSAEDTLSTKTNLPNSESCNPQSQVSKRRTSLI